MARIAEMTEAKASSLLRAIEKRDAAKKKPKQKARVRRKKRGKKATRSD
jgi:hypothetical protein